jgi:hypothetical protein
LFLQISNTTKTNPQGDATKIQNQKFYRSTIDAMKAKEQAKQAKTQEKIQHPVHAPGQNVAAGAGAGEKVPVAEVEKAAVPPATDNEGTEEVSIAGRTKMTVPKKANQDTPSEVQSELKSEEEKEREEKAKREREEKERKEAEATTELNAILKRAPGMSLSILPPFSISCPCPRLTTPSDRLLQILLSLQQESQVDLARTLLYRAETARSRIGPAPAWTVSAGPPRTEHGASHCAQCACEWEEYRWWR